MTLTYAGKSAPSARLIAEAGSFRLNRGATGQINWGRARANTQLNPDISNATDKRTMRVLFAQYGVPAPKLYLGYGEAIGALTQGKTLVGRPDRHMKGRGFWVISNEHELVKALRGTRKKKAATHFMEYIEAPREYRAHIFLGKSIRISEKAHTAFHEYTTRKPQHNVDHVRKAAKQAVKALGMDFGAVDVLANDTECWVTEVNAAPGVGGSMPRLYAETFLRWHRGEL